MKLFLSIFLLVSALNAGLLCRECEGKLQRSSRAIRQFKLQSGYAKGRPGYVIDHIVPLACAPELKVPRQSLDVPSNMQWQRKEAAKRKDKWERKRCLQLQANPRYRP